MSSKFRFPSARAGLVLFAALASPLANAVAFCALRDPVNSIYALFPEADAYRSNVQTVGRDARAAVLDQLPFSLHFNELGRHTLYITQSKGDVIGYVHARSEIGEWGLTEYAWALSTDLRIVGAKIQRSRDRAIRDALDAHSDDLIGQDLSGLHRLYTQAIGRGDAALAQTVKSAMKTIVITSAVWATEVRNALIAQLTEEAFPEARGMLPIDDLYDDKALAELARVDMDESPVLTRSALAGHRVTNAAGEVIGIVVHTSIELEEAPDNVWWFVGSDGAIRRVFDPDPMASRTEFDDVVGRTPYNVQDCTTRAELAALEVATLARRHSRA